MHRRINLLIIGKLWKKKNRRFPEYDRSGNYLYDPLPISTPLELARSIQRKSLEAQCKRLKIPYDNIFTQETRKPEKIVLDSLKEAGWDGSSCEGYTIKYLVKAAALSGIVKDTEKDGVDKGVAVSGLLEGHFIRHGYDTSHLRKEVMKTSNIVLRSRYKKVIKGSSFGGLATPKLATRFLKVLGRESIYNLLEMYGRYNFDVRAGWPDLVVVRDNFIRFVEVKKKDKLNLSQIQTIPELQKCLPSNSSIEVIRVSN